MNTVNNQQSVDKNPATYSQGILSLGYLKDCVANTSAKAYLNYFNFCKKNPNLGLASNLTIGLIAGAGGGIVGADITSRFTSDENLISFNSAGLDWAADSITFLALNKHGNTKYLKKNGELDKKKYRRDNIRASIAFAGIDISYILAKYFIMKNLLSQGVDSREASLITDAQLAPVTALVSFVVAKYIVSDNRKKKTKKTHHLIRNQQLQSLDNYTTTSTMKFDYSDNTRIEYISNQSRIANEDSYAKQEIKIRTQKHKTDKNYYKFRKQRRRF